jgi:selenocysteine-specific elongation factor
MVAGVWGIDLVALIIAADEGVMPQTREHLDICSLLKIKKGMIVLTKIDLVDRELLDLVIEEVSDLVQNTFLRDAPILPVSSSTGEGIPQLVTTLEHFSNEIQERSPDGLFRLPIDRVFVMKGFGTVVTGTLISGSISVGEMVEIQPQGLEGKVRNLQVYNQPVEKAFAGQRTAVNLQGIETAAIERGNVLVHSNTFTPTRNLDAYLEYLPNASRPLKHRAIQRFHIGANNATASIYLLDKDELAPGEGAFVQLRLDRPVVALPQDRFVIRGSGTIQTLGGGVLLDTHPSKHKRHSPSVIKDLTVLKEGTSEQVLGQHILRAGMAGVTYRELLNRVAMPPTEIEAILQKMIKGRSLLLIDPEKMKVIDANQYQLLRKMTLDQLREFHQRSPMKSGLAKEELRTKLPMEVDVKLFQILLQGLIQSVEIILEKDKLRLSGYQISSVDEKGLVKRGEEAVLHGGLQPPSSKELSEEWAEEEEDVRAALEHLVHEGILVKIKSGMYFHRKPFEKLRQELFAYLQSHQEITTAQFKELTGVSRKYAIPLIEYFDQIKLTLRLGEKRVLRSAGGS